MSSPGVIFSLRFVESTSAKDNYSRYAVGYMSRPEVFEKTNTHDNDNLYHDKDIRYDQYGYMSNSDKTDGLFDANEDLVSDKRKAELTNIFDSSQQKGCPLYQGVISFDNTFLATNNINYNSPDGIKKLKEIVRLAVSEMIHSSSLQDNNVVWTAAIHHNTDNIHIHIAIVEKEKVERRFDRLEESSFEKLKSRVANSIVGDERINELKNISQTFNQVIPKAVGTLINISREILSELSKSLPNSLSFQYNRPDMKEYQPIIDEAVIKLVMQSPELLKQFEKAVDSLTVCERLYRTMYGVVKTDRAGTWSDNKKKEMFERCGNAVIHEVKNFQKSGGLAGGKTQDIIQDYNFPDLPEKKQTPKVFNADIYTLKALSQNGNDRALYRLGKAYIEGKEVPKDEKKGLDLLIESAEKGNIYASYTVAKLIEKGIGTAKNLPLSSYYYYKTIEELNSFIAENPLDKCVSAYFKLAEMELHGEGVAFDIEKAVKHYEASAQCENSYAMYKLGKIYLNGQEDVNTGVVKKDIGKVVLYFEESSKRGNLSSSYQLGKLFRDGKEVAKDNEKAEHYFKLSADGGNQFAEYSLAKLYFEEHKNISDAINYFEESAKQGNIYSLYALGKIYFYGNGVERDLEKAKDYFKKSQAGGNDYAKNSLERLYKAKSTDNKQENNQQNFKNKNSTKIKTDTQSIPNIKHTPKRKAQNFKKNVSAVRSITMVKKILRELNSTYERDISRLEREFDYEENEQIYESLLNH